VVLIVAMLFTSLYGWTVERVAYRPLRGSFRLAPLISAIGMSIFLQNFVQVTQARASSRCRR
jgi:branched-chain amino acid transport system permease protein